MTKLQDTQQTIEELKNLCEILYSCPESELVQKYEEYEYFKDKLNSLLSTITRYRIQLSTSEDKAIFGPKTIKIIEVNLSKFNDTQSLVSNYDKLYEIYEDHLYNVYSSVEHLYNEMVQEKLNSEPDEEGLNLRDIGQETKSHLEQIENYKKLQENIKVQEVNFDNIKKNEYNLIIYLNLKNRVELNDMFNKILTIYREDPCNDLEKIIVEIFEEHQENFLKIIENVCNLSTEIARKPDEVSLRILRINNQKLQKDFLGYIYSVKLLKFIGFKIATSQDIDEHLKSLNMKFENEYFLYLHEPDMMTLYSKWKDWLNNLNSVSTNLKKFLNNYKLLKRTENDIRTIVSSSLS